MTWLDYAVLGVMLVSILWGAWRGFIREVVAVLGWFIAFIAANRLAWPLSNALPADLVRNPELRFLLAFMTVFVASLFVTALVGLLLSRLVQGAGLSGVDRALGSVFGVARGLLIIVAFGLLAGLTALPRQPLWRNSVAGVPLSRLAIAIKPWLPRNFSDRLRYD